MLELGIILACGYIAIQAAYVFYWVLLPGIEPARDFVPGTAISVVVPARNEERHILPCIGSIYDQEYPEGLLEVIVVDDHSVDHTLELVSLEFPGAKVLSLGREGMDGGKKNALRHGIQKASGEWIVTVDADCVLSGDALRTSAFAFEQLGRKIVTGPVLIESPGKAIETFQKYELAGLMLVTGSGYQSGLHSLANGAFLSFEKAAYEVVQAEGLQGQFASGDDMFLVEGIERHFPGEASFLKHQSVRAVTAAEPDWKSLIRQRVRWASKNRQLTNWKINLVWGFQWVYGAALLMSLVSSVFNPVGWLPVFGLLAFGKCVGDLLLLRLAFSFFRLDFSFGKFLLSEFYQVVYILAAGIWVLSGGGTYVWKGRRVR